MRTLTSAFMLPALCSGSQEPSAVAPSQTAAVANEVEPRAGVYAYARVPGFEGVFWTDGITGAKWIGTPPSEDEVIELSGFSPMHMKWLSLRRASDAQMEIVSQCRNLRRITIYDPRISDGGMKHFAKLVCLKRCHLFNSPKSIPITDEGLAYLGKLSKLEWLFLENTEVTGHGMSSLKDLKKLRHLCVASAMIKGGGLKSFLS